MIANGTSSAGIFSERNVPLEEFPSLLAMEGQTGACGALFTAIWFGFAWYYFPSMRQPYLIFLAVAIGVAFFLLHWLSFSLTNQFATKIRDASNISEKKDKLEILARKWITFLSICYVLVCCVLIWVTGGATSPFIPFYIMIFTLTIARIKVPFPGLWVLAFFLFAILCACVAVTLLPSPISNTDMKNVQESGFQSAMYVIFICASLIVPTLSAYIVERSEEKRRQANVKQ